VPTTPSPYLTVDQAIERVRAGAMVIVTDDESREDEGDLTMAAARITPAAIAFMLNHGRGLVCMPCAGERLDALGIGPMVAPELGPCDTAFTVSIDWGRCGSGISAADRAATIQAVLDPRSTSADFIRPGHVFPLRARAGGVLERTGHTEAAVDLARLAGLAPVAVICEVLNEDGGIARRTDLEVLARRFGLGILAVEQLVDYRRQFAPNLIATGNRT
jgi:3,4-dihydroxy 2-butanone 4-phosphate synthase/GTP cyclohydrolase II